MEERRRHQRLPVDIYLHVDSLYKEGKEALEEINKDIEVVDISKGGIGFITPVELPLNFFFNARISLGEDRSFYSVLKIIRVHFDEKEGLYHYGCEFVGLADILTHYIDDYEEDITT